MYLNTKTNVDALHAIAELLREEIETLNKKADENIPKVMSVGSYPSLEMFKWKVSADRFCTLSQNEGDWFKIYNDLGYEVETPSQTAIEERMATVLSTISELEASQVKTEEDNKVAIENNKLIRDKIELVMDHIGIPATYSVFDLPTPRSRKREWIRKSSGWTSDLGRCVPVSVTGVKQDTQQLKYKVEQMYSKMRVTLRLHEEETTRKKEEVKSAHVLALLRAKYCPENPFSDVGDVLDEILKKNKYLMLAYHLECVRNDWSDGFYMAEQGLSRFTVETQEDRDIYEDIHGCLASEDGRVFRDTEYGYGYLYSKVEDDPLMKDFRTVREMFLKTK